MCYSTMVRSDLEKLGKDYSAKLMADLWDVFHKIKDANPKKYKVAAEDDRIFPNYYTGIICNIEGNRSLVPMRYSAFPPSYLSEAQAKNLTTFNARRDSLTKRFWSESFSVNHGIIVIKGFYEWVSVKDLLGAGAVSLSDIKSEFAKQSQERKEKILSQGKKYAPTKTELKDPMFRNIIISFQPKTAEDMLVPVIFSKSKEDEFGFAIVTDEPNEEISRAGHDRMPVNLPIEQIDNWLNPLGKTHEQLDALFDKKKEEIYVHRIAEAA